MRSYLDRDPNDCKKGTHADEMKLALIMPIRKSMDSTVEKNYRPISILRLVSKLWKTNTKTFNPFLWENSANFWGYKIGYTTQYALLKLIVNLTKVRCDNSFCAAVFMDLHYIYTINYDLLIAKLYDYGLRGTSLNLFKE